MTDTTDSETREKYYDYANEFGVSNPECVEMTEIEIPDEVGATSEIHVVRGVTDGPYVLVRPTNDERTATWLDISDWTPENDPWTNTDGLSADDPPVVVKPSDHMIDILIRGVSEKAVTIDIAPYAETAPRILAYESSEDEAPTLEIPL